MTGFPGTEPVFSGRVPAEALRQKNRKERSRERVFRKRKPIVRQNRYRRKTLDGFLHRVFFVFGWRGKKRKKARRMGAGKERKAGRGAKERGGVAARQGFWFSEAPAERKRAVFPCRRHFETALLTGFSYRREGCPEENSLPGAGYLPFRTRKKYRK